MRPKIRVLRLVVRVRRVAGRAAGGACYGATVALASFYGLVSLATVTAVVTAVAVVCELFGRERP